MSEVVILVSSHSVNASLRAGKVVLADTVFGVTFRICAYRIKRRKNEYGKYGPGEAFGKSLSSGKWHSVYNVRNE